MNRDCSFPLAPLPWGNIEKGADHWVDAFSHFLPDYLTTHYFPVSHHTAVMAAFVYSRFINAIVEIEICFGQTASHSP